MIKTNAMRLLTQAGIEFTTKEYDVDENDLSGVHAAKELDMPAERLFKTLVAFGEKNGYLVFCIPVHLELDLKKAASLAGEKKIDLIPVKDLLKVTGYIRGGCSPVGMKKKYPVYIDDSVLEYDQIGISAGARGCQLIMNPSDLIAYTGAVTSAVTAGIR